MKILFLRAIFLKSFLSFRCSYLFHRRNIYTRDERRLADNFLFSTKCFTNLLCFIVSIYYANTSLWCYLQI